MLLGASSEAHADTQGQVQVDVMCALAPLTMGEGDTGIRIAGTGAGTGTGTSWYARETDISPAYAAESHARTRASYCKHTATLVSSHCRVPSAGMGRVGVRLGGGAVRTHLRDDGRDGHRHRCTASQQFTAPTRAVSDGMIVTRFEGSAIDPVSP
jgi:hypothetical protein